MKRWLIAVLLAVVGLGLPKAVPAKALLTQATNPIASRQIDPGPEGPGRDNWQTVTVFPGSPGQSLYYAPDQLGSARRVFGASGAPTYDYDPYGRPLQTTAPVTDFNYARTIYNADSGLYLAGHRAYDPVAGRWLSRDPAGEGANVAGNLYGYVDGNPVSLTDPDGLGVCAPLEAELPTLEAEGAELAALDSPAGLAIGLGIALDELIDGGAAVEAVEQTVQAAVEGVAIGATAAVADGAAGAGAAAVADTAAGGAGAGAGASVDLAAAADGGAGTGAAESASTIDTLSAAANRAAATVGPGSGPVYGTAVHSAFQVEVDALGNANLATEQSYLNGEIVDYGTPGSVRLDVVEGPLDNPSTVYDLKTGSATLTPSRILQIQSHLPPLAGTVPVYEVRP
jgi:RHS repeat-associated protein